MALKHIDLPYNLQSVKIDLTAEQEKNCKVLYRYVEDDMYEFAGFYDPEILDNDYPDGFIALPVRSVLRDIVELKQGTSVWNVIGSTGDPYGTNLHPIWIQIWEKELISRNRPHTKKCYVLNSANIVCNGEICGGHIVLTNNPSPARGSNETVYIIPICRAHNNRGNNMQMTVSENVFALLLDKYHQIG